MASAGLTPQVHFVEGSDALREIQRRAVPGARFHDDLSTVPENAPLLLAANEFLDALPVRQLVKAPEGWRERMVAVDESGAFVCVAGQMPMDAAVPEARRAAADGTIVEACPGAAAVVAETARRLAAQGGTALFVDYGHAEPRTGSTLQAVKAHRKVDPFTAPGEVDLTAHVDFATLAEVAQGHGAKWLGTVPQGAWLRTLGIEARAEALARTAPHRRAELMQSAERLTGEAEMGELFKAMGLAAPGWPDGAGFEP